MKRNFADYENIFNGNDIAPCKYSKEIQCKFENFMDPILKKMKYLLDENGKPRNIIKSTIIHGYSARDQIDATLRKIINKTKYDTFIFEQNYTPNLSPYFLPSCHCGCHKNSGNNNYKRLFNNNGCNTNLENVLNELNSFILRENIGNPCLQNYNNNYGFICDKISRCSGKLLKEWKDKTCLTP
ncbi:hypothetical protein PFMG_00747 [Plasmodium falciparum IGH-CR14]|uniref:Uncharacterized protein n=1 Tax=Plasmodium falciparum IGH-CR14 TaxID=580059 RepID=A0A0L1I578_PLAFA|nr:hypothetical protein PFMG_00747 [Plasmodium falciparum IGH-CR14]